MPLRMSFEGELLEEEMPQPGGALGEEMPQPAPPVIPDRLTFEEHQEGERAATARKGFEAAPPQSEQGWVEYGFRKLPGFGMGVALAETLHMNIASKRILSGEADQDDYNAIAGFLQRRKGESERGWLERTGDTAASIPAFATEFVATGGAFTAARNAVLKKLGTGVASRAAATAAATTGAVAQSMANPARIAESIARRQVPKSEQEAIEGVDESLAKSVVMGSLDFFIETASERSGGALAKALGLNKFKNVILARFIRKGATPKAAARQASRLLKRAGYHGIPEELLEEHAGEVSRGLTGVEEDFGSLSHLTQGDLEGLAAFASEEASRAVAFSAFPAAQTPIAAAMQAERGKRLAALKALRAKGPISRTNGRDLGIEGTKREERTANADAEIQQLEQEIQDASTIPRPEAEVREEEGGPDVRGLGEGQVPTEPESEVAAPQEVQVDPPAVAQPEEEGEAELDEALGELGGLLEEKEETPTEPPAPGQYVQWTSQGTDRFEQPQKVERVSDDGQYVFVSGSDAGIAAAEVAAVDETTQRDLELKSESDKERSEWNKRTRHRGGRVADTTFGAFQKEVNAALKLLGLKASDDLSPDGIKKATRRASLAAHPDRGGSAAQMSAVNEANELLLNSPATLERAKRKREAARRGPKDQPVTPTEVEPTPLPAEEPKSPSEAAAPEAIPEPAPTEPTPAPVEPVVPEPELATTLPETLSLEDAKAEFDSLMNQAESVEGAENEKEQLAVLQPRIDAVLARIKELEAPQKEAEAQAKAKAESERRQERQDTEERLISEAPVHQRRNGWEIIRFDKDTSTYVLRDPNDKTEVYRGRLGRVREVADESAPSPVEEKPSEKRPPRPVVGPEAGTGREPGRPEVRPEVKTPRSLADFEAMTEAELAEFIGLEKWKGRKKSNLVDEAMATLKPKVRPGEQLGLLGMEEEVARANEQERRLNVFRKTPIHDTLVQMAGDNETAREFADANMEVIESIRTETEGRIANSENLREWTDIAEDARTRLTRLPEGVDEGTYDEFIAEYIDDLIPTLMDSVTEVKNDTGTFKVGDAVIDNETGEDGVIEKFTYDDDGKAIAMLESQRGRIQDEITVGDLREQQFQLDEAFQTDTREEWDAEIKIRLRERMGAVDYDNANIDQQEGLDAIDRATSEGEDQGRDWYDIDEFRYFEEIAVEAMPEPTAEDATTEVKTREQQVEEILAEPAAAEMQFDEMRQSLESRGIARTDDNVTYKVVPGQDMVGGVGTWDVEKVDAESIRSTVSRGHDNREQAIDAAIAIAQKEPEAPLKVGEVVHVVEFMDDKYNTVTKKFRDLKKANEYARKHNEAVKTMVPPPKEGQKIKKVIKFNKRSGSFDVSQLTHRQASAVDDRLEKEVSHYGDENSPPKLLRKAVRDRERETYPGRPEQSELSKQLDDVSRRFSDLAGDIRTLEQTRQNAVTEKTRQFSVKYGVPNTDRSRRAKKWKGEMANARRDARDDAAIKELDAKIESKKGEQKSLEPELQELRKQVAAERQQAIRESGEMLQPGTIIISNREGASISGRIEGWNSDRGEYDYTPGIFSPTSGTFQSTYHGTRSDNLSHAAATENFSTLDEYQTFEAIQQQATDAIEAMRKERSRVADEARQAKAQEELRQTISAESPVKTTVARVLTDPIYADIGGKNAISDGRFIVTAEAAPANLKKRDKDLKQKAIDKGETSGRGKDPKGPKAKGKPILDAAKKNLERKDDKPLELVAYREGEDYYQAFLTDGADVVTLDADYYNFFSKAGITLHANAGAFKGTNAVLLKKDGNPVGAVMPLTGGDSLSLASIQEVLQDKGQPVSEAAEGPETATEASEQAHQELSDSLDELSDKLKGRLSMNPMLDPEIISAVAKVVAKAIKAKVADFRVLMERVAKLYGEKQAKRLEPVFQQEWDKQFAETVEPAPEDAPQPTAEPAAEADETAEPPEPPPVEPTATGRSPFAGIKRERLERQADEAGLPRPTETESIKAVELVTNAVSQLTTESDKKIQALATDVITTQKPITVEETADLLASVDYHKRQMEEAIDRANEYLANGEQSKAAEEEKDVAVHKAALQNAQQAARDVGRRQFAYMGHVLQILVDRDGAAHIEQELLRANLGQREYDEAGNDVIAEYAKEMADKLDKAKRKQAQRGKQIDSQESLAEANEKIKQLEEELKRDRTKSRKSRGSRNRIVTQEAKDAAVQRIRDRIKKMGTTAHAVPVGPVLQMLPDAAIVAGYVIESGALKLADFSRDMVAEVGDWVTPHLDDLYRTARAEYARTQQDRLQERLGDADDLRGQHRSVAALAKAILAETRHDDGTFISRDELLERLHEELTKIDPSITERETMDLFSGYGKYAELSQDDLEVAYRDRRGEAREIGKIEDMQQKHPPKATGREMHTPSDAERQLHRDVRELKKKGEREGWYYTGDGASRLKGTKEAIKTRLRNELSDLDAQIDARTKTVKNKTAPLTDSEIEALREQRNQRKERLDAIVRAAEEAEAASWESEGGTFVDPAVEAYLKVLDRQIATLKKQLGTKNVFPKPQPSRPGGQAVDVRKLQIESLQAEKSLLRKLLDPNYETNQKLRNAEKAAERGVAKLEKERDEGFKMKDKPVPVPESERLRKARQKLAALRQERLKALEDEYALRAAIAQSKRNAANFADRLARGDFAPRKRKPARTWDDPAWKEAKSKELSLRNEFAEKLAEYEFQNMTPWETTKFYTGRTRTLWKAIMTGLDQTALGLQGGVTMFTNPVVWSKALIPTGKAAVSAKQREMLDAQREAHPDYERYRNYNLALREHGKGRDMASTEFYGNDKWVDKIPGVAISERTFSTFLNELRFNLMRVMEWAYTKDGRAMTEQQGKALARVVNAFTMAYKPADRRVQIAMDLAGEVFWAPSMYAARAQLAVGSPVFFNPGADSRVRMMAAKQYIKAIVGIAAATAALRMLLEDDDEEEVTPVDVDYYKVKAGNIRMDMTSGMGQMMTFGARMLNSLVKARTGDVIWEGRGRVQGARELVGSFASFKVNPWIGAGLDFFSEKDVVGRPTSIANTILSSITPLSVQTVVEAVEEEGAVKGLAWSVPGVTGRNLSIYDRSAPKSEETFLETTKKLVRQIMGQKTPGLTPDELDKWLENKVEWDTDLSGASKFLTLDQMEQAEQRKEKRKQAVVTSAVIDAETDESKEALENAKQKLKDTGWSHFQAQQHLFNHYSGRPKMNWDKFDALGELYGKVKVGDTDPARDEIMGKEDKEGNRPTVPDEFWKPSDPGSTRPTRYDTDFGKWMAEQGARWTKERKKKREERKKK